MGAVCCIIDRNLSAVQLVFLLIGIFLVIGNAVIGFFCHHQDHSHHWDHSQSIRYFILVVGMTIWCAKHLAPMAGVSDEVRKIGSKSSEHFLNSDPNADVFSVYAELRETLEKCGGLKCWVFGEFDSL